MPVETSSSAKSVGYARPELLAPAGDWECVRAAVENGADAVYFGLERFNARMRAKNFTQADLPALMAFLHARGVRGYVTFNVLVFTHELPAAEEYLRSIIAAGVDAAIVQDIGIIRLIRKISPDFPIHGSTQMTVTSAAGVEHARKLGAELVVLGRENSIAEIEKIQSAQRDSGAATGESPLPLEVFVHGALCVAYSGQCLTSESLGGRSANRGECAQACRMPYDLYSDGEKVDLGDRRYLLSPQDLAGIEVLPELVRVGVASLKIEGRLKAPEYVASITRVYRQALDRVMKELNGDTEPTRGKAPPTAGAVATPEEHYQLQMAFSRGQYTGWFRGINNQELAHGRFGTKRGVFLGEITQVGSEFIALRPQSPLKPGDGVVFDAGAPDQGEEGGRVYQVEPQRDGSVQLRFGNGDINFNRVRVGNLLWKNNDPALDRAVRQTFEGETIRHTRPLSLEVHGRKGDSLTLIADDHEGHVVQLDSTMPLALAEKQPLTPERLREQLGRLGGTPFHLGTLEVKLEGAVILPMSELNRLRREIVSELQTLRAAPKRWRMAPRADVRPDLGQASLASNHSAPSNRLDQGRALPKTGFGTGAEQVNGVPAERGGLGIVRPTVEASVPVAAPELIILVRNLGQLDAALAVTGIATVYCEFENPKHYRDAVVRFRVWQATLASDEARRVTSIWVAPPRITKPGEEWILKQVRSCEADGYLVRNHDHLAFFADCRRRGDFSLNVANPLTAEHFIVTHGLERVTASYDLSIQQLCDLLSAAPPAWFDLTLHQHMPMFHMEHCVFCAFLSKGKDYRDCGRPCDKHDVRMRDRTGAEFPLKADAGCRNTVFNNRAQTGAEYAQQLIDLGARSFRVEFVNEAPDEVTRTIRAYQALMRGEISGAELWRELKLLNQLGVTRGQLDGGAAVIHRKA